jgi:hypothetical protein
MERWNGIMAREITCDAELAGIYASMVQCTAGNVGERERERESYRTRGSTVQ